MGYARQRERFFKHQTTDIGGEHKRLKYDQFIQSTPVYRFRVVVLFKDSWVPHVLTIEGYRAQNIRIMLMVGYVFKGVRQVLKISKFPIKRFEKKPHPIALRRQQREARNARLFRTIPVV